MKYLFFSQSRRKNEGCLVFNPHQGLHPPGSPNKSKLLSTIIFTQKICAFVIMNAQGPKTSQPFCKTQNPSFPYSPRPSSYVRTMPAIPSSSSYPSDVWPCVSEVAEFWLLMPQPVLPSCPYLPLLIERAVCVCITIIVKKNRQ